MGRDADQTQETGGNRAYAHPYPIFLGVPPRGGYATSHERNEGFLGARVYYVGGIQLYFYSVIRLSISSPGKGKKTSATQSFSKTLSKAEEFENAGFAF